MKFFLHLFAVVLLLNVLGVKAQSISTFDNFNLPVDTFWNGADTSGGFVSGNAFFGNYYDTQWGSWSGWSYGTMTDTITTGYNNMYSSIAGSGRNSDAYATAYISSFGGPTFISLRNMAIGKSVDGFFISNSTYAYLSMRDGNAYSKKFGGVSGNDSDWFKLKITLYNKDVEVDTTNFYLADFRDSDNSKDYILKGWEWVDLSVFGPIDSLAFTLSSSDNGSFGMNTPAYFCIDDFTTSDGVGLEENIENFAIKIYPNPAQNFVNISANKTIESIEILDFSGRSIMEFNIQNENNFSIDISGLSSGIYILKSVIDGKIISRKFIKE